MRNDVAMAAAAADWWADRFGLHEFRARFRDEVRLRVFSALRHGEPLRLYCDHDPQDDLLSVVRAAGAECSGTFFSGRDMGMPSKTGLFVTATGEILTKEGYGAKETPLVVAAKFCLTGTK